MIRLLGILMCCTVLQGSILADENAQMSTKCHKHKCCRGATGPQGNSGSAGDPGPDFGQFACLYNNVGQTLTTGQNVLFQNEISLAGITYDNTTGTLTLQPGTYSVTYFIIPSGNYNLVANGTIVPNAPLAGSSTILTFSNATNTLVLQAQSDTVLSPGSVNQCSAMITVYQIN